MIKRIIFLLLLVCIFCTSCKKQSQIYDTLSIIENRGKIIVGIKDDIEPFGFYDKQNKIVGYEIDIAKNIAKSILGSEEKLELVPVTNSNRLLKLSNNQVDILISTLSITPQRQTLIEFSTPYHIAGQAIMVKQSNKYSTLRDFKGKKLIVVFGSTSERNLRENAPDVEVLGYKTYTEAYSALKEGKADGIIADDSILYGFATKDNTLKILPKRYTQEPYAVGLRKESESKRLLEKINLIITNLNDSGELKNLKNKWNIK